jgi:hypothetical protein
MLPTMDHQNAGTEDYESVTRALEKSTNLNSHGRKWRRSIRLGAMFCGISLAINIAVTIFSYSSKVDSGGSRRILYHGDCKYARKLNTMIHLGINLISTILLASSNYAMQCLSAPTRREVDKAHACRIWLDIGIPSFRNLARISQMRAFLWLLLALSSLPLHLMYVDFSKIAKSLW